MKKVKRYAEKSRLMDVSISYGDEDFHFNLFAELVIDENTINNELMVQPSSYAFLSMLHKKVLRIAKDKKAETEKIYANKYVLYKKQIDTDTNRQNPKETAKELAIRSKDYQNSLQEYHKAEEDAGIIEVCVKAFEQRKDLIQTLSANIRKSS